MLARTLRLRRLRPHKRRAGLRFHFRHLVLLLLPTLLLVPVLMPTLVLLLLLLPLRELSAR